MALLVLPDLLVLVDSLVRQASLAAMDTTELLERRATLALLVGLVFLVCLDLRDPQDLRAKRAHLDWLGELELQASVVSVALPAPLACLVSRETEECPSP